MAWGPAMHRPARRADLPAERLTRLTHNMLKDYPGVHRWEETDDILQNATLRLCGPWRR